MDLLISKNKMDWTAKERIKIRQQINNLETDRDNIHDTSAIIIIVVFFVLGCCFVIPWIFCIMGIIMLVINNKNRNRINKDIRDLNNRLYELEG